MSGRRSRATPSVFSTATTSPATLASAAAESDAASAGSLVKGLGILHAFRAGETYLGNKELAARAGLTKPTVSRLAGRLVELGYLRYSDALGQYALGVAVLKLSYPMLAGLSIRQIARPVMKELADAIEGQCSMGMCSELDMVFIETSRSARHRFTLPEAGATIPILVSAMGRAYCAALSAVERERLCRRMKAEQPAYWAEHGNKIRLSASEYVRLGFTWSTGDARPELHACAVPLRTRLDGEIVVLNCSVRARDLKVRQLEQEIGPQIVAAARRIDSGMGVAWNAN